MDEEAVETNQHRLHTVVPPWFWDLHGAGTVRERQGWSKVEKRKFVSRVPASASATHASTFSVFFLVHVHAASSIKKGWRICERASDSGAY